MKRILSALLYIPVVVSFFSAIVDDRMIAIAVIVALYSALCLLIVRRYSAVAATLRETMLKSAELLVLVNNITARAKGASGKGRTARR